MGLLGVAAAGAALGGCSVDPQDDEWTRAAGAAIQKGGWERRTLGWGAGPEEVGLRAAAKDFPAEGPSSVAVGPSGAVVLLDRLNERVVQVSANGDVRSHVKVARETEHVAVGSDGAIAAWSPLTATVWISGRDGAPLGEVTVPRALRDVARFDLGLSHRVLVTTSTQETMVLGSPRAPLDLASALRSKREGAAFLADGRGVAARVTDGAGEILVYRKPVVDKDGDSKVAVASTFPIEAPVAAVRIVGATGNVVCARVERVTQAAAPESEVVVEREALCVDVDTGSILARRPMGRRGLYTMHADVAVGGNPPVLAIVKPEEDGLHLERIPLSAAAVRTEVAR